MNLFKIFRRKTKEKILASNPKLQEIVELMKKADDIDESMVPHEFAAEVSWLLNGGPKSREDIIICYTPMEYVKAGRELDRKSREKFERRKGFKDSS